MSGSSTASFHGLLHDAAASPRSGGVSYEVSSLTYFSELLNELDQVEQELEAEGDVSRRQGGITSRIEDRLINKHIRRGRLQRRNIIVDNGSDDESERRTSTHTRRILAFPAQANRTRGVTAATDRPSSSIASTSKAARGA